MNILFWIVQNIYRQFLELTTPLVERKVVPVEPLAVLMLQAGYILKECHSEEEIQAYRIFYANGESLCTFKWHRLDFNRVFFAVKNNAHLLKRDDFKNPDRQD